MNAFYTVIHVFDSSVVVFHRILGHNIFVLGWFLFLNFVTMKLNSWLKQFLLLRALFLKLILFHYIRGTNEDMFACNKS